VTEFLTIDDLLAIAPAALGGQEVVVRDIGLLSSAVARPLPVFGTDPYPTIHAKAAALLHSITNNHALIDGNKRLAWLATYVFLDINGCGVTASDGDVVELVTAVASGQLDDVTKIAERLIEMCVAHGGPAPPPRTPTP
jgi:death-on-curing protein